MAFLSAAVGLGAAGGGSLLSGLSAVLGAAGSIFSGIAGYQASKYQAKVAEMNAGIAEENANRATLVSQQEQLQTDRQNRGLIGEMVAGQGASGLSLTGGSFMKTRSSARKLARLDALNVRQAGEVEAYGYRTDAVNQRAQGQLAKMQGTSNLVGSFINAGTSLIGSASSSGASSGFFKKKGTSGSSDPWRGMRVVG